MRQVRHEGRRVELTLAGATWWYGCENQMVDPYVREVLQGVEEVGGTYLVHVTRNQVPKLIRRHDIVGVSSRWNDPMPQVVFEAMASGCALVSTQRGRDPGCLRRRRLPGCPG